MSAVEPSFWSKLDQSPLTRREFQWPKPSRIQTGRS